MNFRVQDGVWHYITHHVPTCTHYIHPESPCNSSFPYYSVRGEHEKTSWKEVEGRKKKTSYFMMCTESMSNCIGSAVINELARAEANRPDPFPFSFLFIRHTKPSSL